MQIFKHRFKNVSICEAFSTVLDNKTAAKKIISDHYIDKIDDNIFKGFPTIDYIGGKCFSDILHTRDFRFRISEHDGHPNEEDANR